MFMSWRFEGCRNRRKMTAWKIIFKEMKTHILESQELLEIQRKSYQSAVNGGILVDHFMSLGHGLRFIGSFFEFSEDFMFIDGIKDLIYDVKLKLYQLSHLRNDENLVMNLDHEYADLREQFKNVIIGPGINKYHMIFPESFDYYAYKEMSLLLCEIIEELVSSDCKGDQISPVMKELEDIRKMLSLLEPFFKYAKYSIHAIHFDYEGPGDNPFSEHEEEKKILSIVAGVMERVTCFIYLSAVGKMDDEMVLSLKNSSSDLIIEETQIMKMYLSLHVDFIENLKSHISMSLRLLEWNKRCYFDTELGEALEDHFTSIEHGLQYLVKILKVTNNEDLELRVHRLIDIVKQKLHSLPHSQNDENLTVNLEHAYGELRKEMKNVVIKPQTDDYDTLFPKILNGDAYLVLEEIIISTLLELTSSRKADQTAPMMKEIKGLMNKLISLKPLFDYARTNFQFAPTSKPEETKVNVALTTFLGRAICVIYLSFVAELHEDMVVSLRKNFSALIEETEIKKMSLVLGIIFEDDLESDIDISLSLMKRHQEYHIYTITEAAVEDHIISLKHGIEFLKWFFNIYNIDEDLQRCITLLAGNVKKKLKFLTYKQVNESQKMDVNAAYAALREEMKNVIIKQRADKYESLFPELIPAVNHYDSRLGKNMKAYIRRNYDFLCEKIMTLVTSNFMADQIAPLKKDQIAPLKKELQDLWKRLKVFKPLGLYICGISCRIDKKQTFKTLLTFHHKATFLTYMTFVGTMDIGTTLLIKSSISMEIKETDDVLKIYTLILNEFLSEGDYYVEELYILKNLIVLLERNGEFLDDANFKLYEVLIDIHSFLLALPRNVMLRKLHLLKESFDNILLHSIPIIYSCYLVPAEVDISAKFNRVLDLIKNIKSEAVQMKLYYVPRVDDVGFLEFFLGYLEDLTENQEILLKEETDALRFEVGTLLSLAKSTNREELNKNPWNDIMNLAYQAEYIIDLYLVSSPRDSGLLLSLSKIIHQLHNITADVNDAVSLDSYHLGESLPTQDVRGTTTQLTDNDSIVGLQEETKNIMDSLLKGENKLTVVAIIGMAGVGKTTLAFTLYNTPSTAHHFDIRARCAVSQSYQLRSLLISIVDQVNPSDQYRNMDDEALSNHLSRSLKKRRYLIVLDDVWDTGLWNYLKRYLPDDKNGSRIIITTRNRDVADQIGSKVNQLHQLSEENSWLLFQKKMLEKESLSDALLNISKGIVRNCEGLPLSIVIIAGILSGIERTKEKWNKIAESVNSFVLSDPLGNCRAILELSYNNLPNHLRKCFLYLGSFPEDQEIPVNRLIRLWIGEGFVQDTKIGSAEEVAQKYIEDLIVKSLVVSANERSRGGVKTFRLHDLLRDFCLDKAKEKHFFTLLGDEALDEINLSLALQDPRRIIINGSHDLPRKIVDFSCHSVRSMICHKRLDSFEIKKRIGSCDMVLLNLLEVDEVCSELFPVDYIWLTDFPDISSLVHLRYLGLRLIIWRNSVLPSSISKLQNLQILILRSNCSRKKVPDFIWDMVKLRHIHIDGASFEIDSKRLQNSSFLLQNLKSLSGARVSNGDSKWLNKLPALRRLFCLIEDDLEVEAVREVNGDLEVDDITEVSDDIEVDDITEVSDDIEGDDVTEVNDAAEVDDVTEVGNNTKLDDVKEVDAEVNDNHLQMLSFNGTLISLKVTNVTDRVQRFIRTCQLPTCLRKLTLYYFYLKSNDISTIGQALTQLEVFKIYSCDTPSGYEWNVEDDDFPELKVLKLRDLKISKWIASENSFPNLEQLFVEKCDSLDEIPPDFGYLLKLRLISIKDCPPCVDSSAREIEKIQHEEQNIEMRVRISQKLMAPS